MFIGNEEVKLIWDAIRDLQDRINIIASGSDNIVEPVNCEGCGCLIQKEQAIIGKSEIRTRNEIVNCYGGLVDREYIHTTHWCKRCVPKELKEAK